MTEEIKTTIPPLPFKEDSEPVITTDDRDRYFDAILMDTPYRETFELFDGRLHVTLRTRYLNESQQIFNKLKTDTPQIPLDFENLMAQLNLAYALVSIEDANGVKKNFDQGTVEERIKRIGESFLTSKYLALIELLRLFDRKVSKMMEESTQPNFWKTADGS